MPHAIASRVTIEKDSIQDEDGTTAMSHRPQNADRSSIVPRSSQEDPSPLSSASSTARERSGPSPAISNLSW
jgi:hypothetical protein